MKRSYTKEFETKIININKENKTIELENTAFYGKNIGQPGNSEILVLESKTIKVIETFKKEDTKSKISYEWAVINFLKKNQSL